jgi:predicted RNase H-like nuclease
MAWIAGVDGCPFGWFFILYNTRSKKCEFQMVRCFPELLRLEQKPDIITIDIPIGLLTHARQGGRKCDRHARQLLGPIRQASVFSPPVRAALQADTFEEANTINRQSSPENIGISIQAFALFPKLRDIDSYVTPELQAWIKEVHPELCFYEMNEQHPLTLNKRTFEGQKYRLCLLRENGFSNLKDECIKHFIGMHRNEAGYDDVLDAFAALWTAKRIASREAEVIPQIQQTDERQLNMEMWR